MRTQVLIVDDAPFIREILISACESAGYWVVGEASNGREAIERAEFLQPDIIIMDLVMPEMNGVDAIREISQNMGHISIIACSSLSEELIRLKALEAGAKEFLLKPFSPEQVAKCIESVKPEMKLRRANV